MKSNVIVLITTAGLLCGAGYYFWDSRVNRSDVMFARLSDTGSVRAEVVFARSNVETSTPGLAHYTEHLVWQNAIGGGREVDRHTNAWTSDIAVGYWLSGPPEDLPEILAKLKRVFDPLTISAQYAEEERDIIQREYERVMADNPSTHAREDMQAFLYDGTIRGQSIIGTPAQIKAFTYDQAKALHAEVYVPHNVVLVVTGEVTQRRLARALRDVGWPDEVAVAAEVDGSQMTVGSPTTQTFTFPDADAVPQLIWRRVVTLDVPIPFDLLEGQTALLRDVLDTNLPGGVVGPLHFDAAFARRYDIQVYPIDEDTVEMVFRATPDASVSLADLQTAFTETLSTVAADGIPDTTYRRVLKRFDGFWPDWTEAEDVEDWMADYVVDRVSDLRRPLPQRELQTLKREFSLASTNTLLRQIAAKGRTAIAYIGPEDRFQ